MEGQEVGDAREGLTLPRPEGARLEAFSLFERATTVHTKFAEAPVFCLVGANGLGKSTFLAAISYAITGAVAQPDRQFRGAAEYYKQARTYASRYFHGRIAAEDAEAAQISLTMAVGEKRYELTRGMFDAESLRELRILDGSGVPVVHGADDLTPEDRHRVYVENLVTDVGVDDFAQLVFLQLFVLSFDERRELLFWSPKLMEQALHISFGLDTKRAREAERFRRRMEGLESLARNAQWQATNVRKQLDALTEASDDLLEESVDQADDHRQLEERRDEAVRDVEEAGKTLNDAHLDMAARSAQLQALRAEYDSVWNQRLQGHGHPGAHPVVVRTLDDARCAICGTEGDAVKMTVEERLAAHACPLCGSDVKRKESGGAKKLLARLSELDQAITAAQTGIADAEPIVARLERELSDSRDALVALNTKLAEFEEKNDLAVAMAGDGPSGLEAVASRYRAQIADLQKERDDRRKERNQARDKLAPLQDSLVRSYAAAEDHFVPSFNELARKFLGLELEIEIEQTRDSVNLVLSVEGTRRRAEDALSESQRFFVDIALRMALVEQMSADGSPACLFIDTPEGSLDIAYESRAGEMFAVFVQRGNQLVMTANINTSQLLQRLAKTCGAGGVVLERMTEWTNLSEVQIAEEDAFESAWQQIKASIPNRTSGRRRTRTSR